jgi:hypothetical protein
VEPQFLKDWFHSTVLTMDELWNVRTPGLVAALPQLPKEMSCGVAD